MIARRINRLAGSIGGLMGGRSGARRGMQMVANARKQGGATSAAFRAGGMSGAFGTMRDPLLSGMMKGAMIGAGINTGRQMMENSSYGAPMTAGMGGAAIRGAIGGGMLGGAMGVGGHFARGGLSRARPVAAGMGAAAHAAPAARQGNRWMQGLQSRMNKMRPKRAATRGMAESPAFSAARAEVNGLYAEIDANWNRHVTQSFANARSEIGL